MATLKILGTVSFEKLWSAIQSHQYRVIVLIGGSRSGKTWAIIQAIIILALQVQQRITCWRLKRTWIKATVYKDFIKYLSSEKVYSPKDENKSELLYKIGDSFIEFGGLDDSQKLHGMTQDIAWLNEAMEATKEDFDQLEQRTSNLIIIDCNPTEEEHWIYDLKSREDVLFIHSTFKDNAFIPVPVRRKILSYEPTPHNIKQKTADEYKWKVYGLGIVAEKEGLIFKQPELIKEVPAEAKLLGRGLDFGFFPDPVASGCVWLYNGRLLFDEDIYETELNNVIIDGKEEIPSIQGRFNELGVSKRDGIVADSAAKSNISELKTAGFNIEGVKKWPGSVKDGIELMKNYEPFYVTERSVNTIKELKNYTYLKNFATGKFTKEPIDDYNHLIDLYRYVVQTFIGKKGMKKPKTYKEDE